MKIPNNDVLKKIEIILGDFELHVIDSRNQTTEKMGLATLRKFKNHDRDRILNTLSLELSSTKAANLVSPPSAVRWLSWSDRVQNIDPNWYPEK